MDKLSNEHIITIKDAANKLTGALRRKFQGHVAFDYLDSRARLAEEIFGW